MTEGEAGGRAVLFGLMILLLVTVGCTAEQPVVHENDSIEKVHHSSDALVYRFVDSEARVVCWVQKYSHSGGLSCMPINETDLRDDYD